MNIKRLDTLVVTVNAPADVVWEFMSQPENWRGMSDFWRDAKQISPTQLVTHTAQGDITVTLFFDRTHYTLDQVVNLPNGDEQLIPYRILPNGATSRLMMTNQQTANVSDAEYEEQMGWIQQELDAAKQLIEASQPDA